MDRNCNECKNQTYTYSERLHCFVFACRKWECEFERKNDEDISDNACHAARTE